MKAKLFRLLEKSEEFRTVFRKAASSDSKFSMSSAQYKLIAEEVLSLKGCSFLVFGAGHDSGLWYFCSKGNMVLVENNPDWISDFPGKIIRHVYGGRVGVWLEKICFPEEIQRVWDFILIDGPTGYSKTCIGRQEPIAFASKYGKTVFVHDWERNWEQQLCKYYLGNPNYILPFRDNSPERTLAIFHSVRRTRRGA